MHIAPIAEIVLSIAPPPTQRVPGNFAQAPRFGNGRTITDLAKCIFTEIGLRIDGEGGNSGDHNDQRASAEDIRRSTAAILQQMAKVSDPTAGPIAPPAPKAAFFAGSQAPKTTVTKTETAAATAVSPDKVAGAKRTVEERDAYHEEGSVPGGDSFLSVEDFKVLRGACEIAGVPADSPDSVLEASEALRRAFLLARAEGGAGLSPQRAEAFMRKVLADRAALSGAGQEAADKAARLASDEADAEAALAEAEATLAKAEGSGDDQLLATLMQVKRAKARAAQKAKEERERELALEAASQAALRRMGVCPAGYQWLHAGGGWRCSAGGHFVSGSAVAAEMARGGSS